MSYSDYALTFVPDWQIALCMRVRASTYGLLVCLAMGLGVEAKLARLSPTEAPKVADTDAPELWEQVIKPPVAETLHVQGLSFVFPPEPNRFREVDPIDPLADKAKSANSQVAGLALDLVAEAEERARNPKWVRPTAPPTEKPLIPRKRRKTISKEVE